MNMPPKFSVIVINYNSAQCCVDLIKEWSKPKQLSNWEMIILENGSPQQKNEVRRIKQQIAAVAAEQRIKLLTSSINLGFGGGNNMAAQNASGEWLFFLNADTLVEQSILVALEHELLKIQQATGQLPVVLAPALVLADGKTRQEFAWGVFPTLKGLLKQNNKNVVVPVTNESYFAVDWVSGAALVIAKKSFDLIGGFDENYFMYFEDVDLCKSVVNALPKQKIYVDTKLKITHLGGKSLKINRQRYRLYFKAQCYYFRKHLGIMSALAMSLIRWPYKLWRLYFYKP